MKNGAINAKACIPRKGMELIQLMRSFGARLAAVADMRPRSMRELHGEVRLSGDCQDAADFRSEVNQAWKSGRPKSEARSGSPAAPSGSVNPSSLARRSMAIARLASPARA